jgi:hypothetical protein
MIFEKVVVKLDIDNTEELDFLSKFYKEYTSTSDARSKTFDERMKDDILKRQYKNENIKCAEKKVQLHHSTHTKSV